MTRPGRRTRAAVFLRSFAIQGSWNYRTLIGTGFGFALLPALRALYRDDPGRLHEAIERHTRLFNSHPYLAPVALGAVATPEADGADAQVVERFKAAVRGSLGSLGDHLLWAGWRPVCLLLALALLLAGAAWWICVIAFLAVYNAGHLLVRIQGYRVGLREGLRVGESLRRWPVARVQRALTLLGAFFVGLLVPMAAAGLHLEAAGVVATSRLPARWIVIAAAAALVGARAGAAIRAPLVLALAGLSLFGLLLGVLA